MPAKDQTFDDYLKSESRSVSEGGENRQRGIYAPSRDGAPRHGAKSIHLSISYDLHVCTCSHKALN